jgi:hypothetical protein
MLRSSLVEETMLRLWLSWLEACAKSKRIAKRTLPLAGILRIVMSFSVCYGTHSLIDLNAPDCDLGTISQRNCIVAKLVFQNLKISYQIGRSPCFKYVPPLHCVTTTYKLISQGFGRRNLAVSCQLLFSCKLTKDKLLCFADLPMSLG